MKIYTKQEWYTPSEVVVHNKPGDCWITLHGKVLDLTKWLEYQLRMCKCPNTCSCQVKNWYCGDNCVDTCTCFKRGFFYCDAKRLATTILAHAGKDVSHWFKGEDWIQYTHPVVMSTTKYHRYGNTITDPVVPSTKWRPVPEIPWWEDEKLVVGKLTAKTRPIRIVNTVTSSTVTLEVCSEETIYQIIMRYIPYNCHVMSYTLKYLGRALCYNRTLEENEIPDERDMFSEMGLPENLHIPALLIYYNDDLTEDPPPENCFCTDKDCLAHPEMFPE